VAYNPSPDKHFNVREIFQMSNPKDLKSSDVTAVEAKESRLRSADLEGPDQKIAADHVTYKRSRNPDTELHLDGEDESLYNDGLDISDDTDVLAGTDGGNPGGVKG
jgi:hemin uptake protein HemP